MKNIFLMVVMFSLSACNSEQIQGEDIAKKESSSRPPFTRYIVGKPNMAYVHAEEQVALRWGINLKHTFLGSKSKEELESKRLDIKESNKQAYHFYEEKFGKNWQVKFKAEVEEEMGKKR